MDSPSELEHRAASELPTLEGPFYQERPLIANRYAVLTTLGKGGMGEVWRAYDQKLRVDVALKSLRVDLTNLAERAEALRQEVRIAREVISPNVCRIFDLVIEEDRELISMEYIDGTTLMEMLIQKGSLELRQARDIAAQFLAGLEAIHQAGLVHRDLKPENIMITRAGRVVVMDFGIAKPVTQVGGTVSGTLPYMAPEHLSGERIDARSDVFSAGVVLAEMIHPQGILSIETRQDIWNAVRDNPMRLPEGPWKAVIMRAVAADPQDRYPSAAALSRALEEATMRVDTVEEQKPYPGLSSFTAEDAEYFFGRELEVENAIKKLQQLHLMALVGPSGAGKTSFLRAGLIPALPPGWNHIFCAPGDSPVLNLAQSLIPHFAGNTEAMQKILRFEDQKISSSLLTQWRKQHKEVILIVDRFEELFTLNTPEVQTKFAQLVADASLDSDVRVLLSMRDDFLLRCHDFASLSPLFSELTPLGPMNGSALRRALIQPALKAGYRFQDESLMDQILSDVEKERGALPLMAFAAARLWEKRDRQSGQLTRESYQQIGGVAGALAQHAEETMERIGSERQPIVREIFRNLITSENTRAARDTEELLSIFPQKQIAEEVLRALIDARLLTSFEATSLDGEKPKRRVEIIHESLLTAWPRLVRWQTQDADGAQLRDQLRQAAQLWERRSRSEDLLWTGTAFLEFRTWRQRYPGNLTPTEEAFAHAMLQRANRRRRQRRLFVATVFVILLAVLGIISSFWRKATVARDEAVKETHRAEASKMLALGRANANSDVSTKLAYALASLESSETPEARRYAMQALSEGPPAQVMPFKRLWNCEMSPDGKWLAATDWNGSVKLFSQNGAKPLIVSEPYRPNHPIVWKSQFSPDSRFLLWTPRKEPSTVRVWSISEKKVIRTFKFEGMTIFFVRSGNAFFVSDLQAQDAPFFWNKSAVRVWNFGSEEPRLIGTLKFERNYWTNFDIDSQGKWIAYHKAQNLYVRSLELSSLGAEILVGVHPDEIRVIRFRPNTDQVAASDQTNEIRLWSLVPLQKNPNRIFPGNESTRPVWFDPKGQFLFAPANNTLLRWDLLSPSAEPVVFRNMDNFQDITFDREERWMAIAGGSSIAFYPLTHTYPYLYKANTQNQGSSNVRFSPDGRFFVNCFSNDGLLITSMPGEKYSRRMLRNFGLTTVHDLDIDRSGTYVLASVVGEGIHLISISDGKDLPLKGKLNQELYYGNVAFSSDAKYAAASGEGDQIEVWDLQSGNSRVSEKIKGSTIHALQFGPNEMLFAGDKHGKLFQWNLKDDSVKIQQIGNGDVSSLAVSKNGTFLATVVAKAENEQSELKIRDLKTGKFYPIASHGNRVTTVTFDPDEKKIITVDSEGILRVGPVSGETPHLLLGGAGKRIDIDPSGKWIATDGNPVRLWRMPKGSPIESLSFKEFLNRLRDLTNVRIIVDKNSPTGYRTENAQFAGWAKATDW